MRRKLVVGNWKMNGSRAALAELAPIAAAAREAAGVDVGVCLPAILIPIAVPRAGGLAIGGQDCHSEEAGAYTGDQSAAMLQDAGAKIVIVGHSERRQYHCEDNAAVRAKAETALHRGLMTIVCVGESEAQREAGRALEVVETQLRESLPHETGAGELVVAYEPIWAIGTGKTATPADVAEMHGAIRRFLTDNFGDRGGRIRIL
ncbi:MAG: triose-phosphate isomerase, partial [Sphingomonadales bacterium]